MPKVVDHLDLTDQARLTVHKLPDPIFRSRVRILVVVDTQISITTTNAFGVARIIPLLRETSVGCTRFRVDIAVHGLAPFVGNGTVGPEEARFEGLPLRRRDERRARAEPLRRGVPLRVQARQRRRPGQQHRERRERVPRPLDAELAVLTDWMNGGAACSPPVTTTTSVHPCATGSPGSAPCAAGPTPRACPPSTESRAWTPTSR